jgi:hypothetical protein
MSSSSSAVQTAAASGDTCVGSENSPFTADVRAKSTFRDRSNKEAALPKATHRLVRRSRLTSNCVSDREQSRPA